MKKHTQSMLQVYKVPKSRFNWMQKAIFKNFSTSIAVFPHPQLCWYPKICSIIPHIRNAREGKLGEAEIAEMKMKSRFL